MSTENKRKKGDLALLLERSTGGPVTLGKLLEAIRLSEEKSQPDFAKVLKISKSHLNDIEKGRKAVSPERAAKFAKILRYSEERFVALSLQGLIDQAGLKLLVECRAA
jgi:transcriptional regulator with XRE-family HTH domain